MRAILMGALLVAAGAAAATVEQPLTGELLDQRCEEAALPPRLQQSYCGVAIALGADPSDIVTIAQLIDHCPDQTAPYHSWALQSAYCSVLAHHAADPAIQAEALFESAYALDEIGRFDEAIADLDRALELRPDHYDTLVNRGLAKRKAGRLAEALEDYGKAINIEPGRFNAYNNRGVVFIQQERYGRAVDDFRKALDVQPGNHLTRFNLALALQRDGRLRAALANYEALAAAGDSVGDMIDLSYLHASRAEAYADLEDGPAAVAAYEEVVRYDPSESTAHFMLAQLRAFGPGEVRDFDKALFHAEENLRLDPADGLGVYVLARIHAGAGDVEAAVTAHRRLVDNHWLYESVYISVLKSKGYLAGSASEDQWSEAAQAALTECARDNCTIFDGSGDE